MKSFLLNIWEIRVLVRNVMVFTGGVILFGGDIGAAYLLESSVIETINNTAIEVHNQPEICKLDSSKIKPRFAIETMNFIMDKYPIQWKKG